MSTPDDRLSGLVERLEKSSGPDRELDGLILKAVNPNVVQTYRGLPDYATEIVYVEGKQAPVVSSIDVPFFTSSIDAAMMLVPEGWCCGFEHGGKFDRNPNSEAWCWPFNSDFEPDWQRGDEGYRSAPDGHRGVGTAAIALCVAALRALSASKVQR